MALLIAASFGLAQESGSKKTGEESSAKTKKTDTAKAKDKKVSLYMKAMRNKETAGKSTLVITNDSLTRMESAERLTIAPKSPGGDFPELSEYKDTNSKGEEYWQTRMKSARSQVDRLEQRVQNIQSEINRLQTDFYRWDDPSYRDSVIKPAWDQAVKELEQTKKDLETAKQTLANLPDEARKAGALPGWLR